MYLEDMRFEKFEKEDGLLYFLRGCTAFDGGPFDIDAFQRGPRGGAHLRHAIRQRKEIEFGRDERGNGICRSRKSEVLLEVNGMVLVETHRLIQEESGKKRKVPTDTSKILRTISETGKILKTGAMETPEETAIRGLWGEGRVKVKQGELLKISTPELPDFSDPRNRHKSTVYTGLWRITMTTRFALSRQKRPKRWAEKLYVKDDNVEVWGIWKKNTGGGPYKQAPPILRAIDFSLPSGDPEDIGIDPDKLRL